MLLTQEKVANSPLKQNYNRQTSLPSVMRPFCKLQGLCTDFYRRTAPPSFHSSGSQTHRPGCGRPLISSPSPGTPVDGQNGPTLSTQNPRGCMRRRAGWPLLVLPLRSQAGSSLVHAAGADTAAFRCCLQRTRLDVTCHMKTLQRDKLSLDGEPYFLSLELNRRVKRNPTLEQGVREGC